MRIVEEAGLPDGVLSEVVGAGSEIGDASVTKFEGAPESMEYAEP
ncbi:MAG: hypothetical protein Q4G34_01500 [Micrococcus sp.]|nr:hypothetical protein [Micrococcus sp.]